MSKIKKSSNPSAIEANKKMYNNFFYKQFTPFSGIGINHTLEKPNLDKILNQHITKANYETLLIIGLTDNSNRKKVKSAGNTFSLLKEGFKRNLLKVQLDKAQKNKKRRNSISIYYDIKKQISSAMKKKNIFSYQEFLKLKHEKIGNDFQELKEFQELREKQRKEKVRKMLEERREKELEEVALEEALDHKNKEFLVKSVSMNNSKSFKNIGTKNNLSKITLNEISRMNSHQNPQRLRFSSTQNFMKKIIGKSKTIKNNDEEISPKGKEKQNLFQSSINNFTEKNSNTDENLKKKSEINHETSSIEENIKKLEKNDKFNFTCYNTYNSISKKFFITSNLNNFNLRNQTKGDKENNQTSEDNLSNLLSTRSQLHSEQKTFPKFYTNSQKINLNYNPYTQTNLNSRDNLHSGSTIFKFSKMDINEDPLNKISNAKSAKNYNYSGKLQNFLKQSSIKSIIPTDLHKKSSKKIILRKCNDFIQNLGLYADNLESYEVNGNIKNHLKQAKSVLKSSEMKNLKIVERPSEFSDVHIKSNGMISYIDNKKANLIKYTDSCMTMSNNMIENLGMNQIERKYKKYAIDADLVFGYDCKVNENFDNSETKLNKIRKGLYKMQSKNSTEKSKEVN